MSIVGPRPPVTYHPYNGYKSYSENAKKRFLMRPGITGLAQVERRNSATWDERIEIDVQYVEQFNILLDIAVAAINQVDEIGNILKTRSIDGEEKLLTKYEGMEELLFSQRISNSVCNKLFKRELFSKIRFPVGKLYEDEYVTYKLFDKAHKIYICTNAFYFYRYNESSITHCKFSEREFDRIIASELKIEFCNNNYPKLVHLAEKYLVYDAIIALSKMDVYKKSYDRYIAKNIRK